MNQYMTNFELHSQKKLLITKNKLHFLLCLKTSYMKGKNLSLKKYFFQLLVKSRVSLIEEVASSLKSS